MKRTSKNCTNQPSKGEHVVIYAQDIISYQKYNQIEANYMHICLIQNYEQINLSLKNVNAYIKYELEKHNTHSNHEIKRA